MTQAFVDRPPTTREFEIFRLILSTYQDGSGMLVSKEGKTLPGWRDFERAVASAFNGVTKESKYIFDVILPNPIPKSVKNFGISCKMRSELNRVDRDGRVTIELSNSVKKFNDFLNTKGINRESFQSRATDVGYSIVELVEIWKNEVSHEIELSKSSYLTLMYNDNGLYQIHWFNLSLPNPKTLRWYYPEILINGEKHSAAHLNGDDSTGGRLFEWYSDSGGQLKYYPLATSAKWASPRFRLQPITEGASVRDLVSKAHSYFQDQWPKDE